MPTFSGNETEAYIQAGFRSTVNSTYGSQFGLGYNPAGETMSDSARQLDHVGPRVYRARTIVGFYDGGGTLHSVDLGSGALDDFMAELRLGDGLHRQRW